LNGVETAGTGTFSLSQLYPGNLLYKQSLPDVSAAFNGNLIIKALYPPSATTADQPVFDPIPFIITAS